MFYKPVIGLEVHTELHTKSKCFCGCSTEFGKRPNSQTCPVCLGLPGSLPVLNEAALQFAIKTGLGLNCRISRLIKFDRKDYFYPDLPKNFQISQPNLPLAQDGWLRIDTERGVKKIGIRQAHLEEDVGKLIHPAQSRISLVDFNRNGIPLLEIVTEPDMNSSQEVYDFLLHLKSILKYLEVSDCNMEEGSLRCDANISLMPKGSKTPGQKVEVKNMNSFKAVKQAVEYEVKRQEELLDNKKEVVLETRLWDVIKNVTAPMRTKAEAQHHYNFPEPDLVPFILEDGYIQKIKESLPELPKQRAGRFIREYKIPEYDAGVLTADKYLADYFEECARLYPQPKVISNWLMTQILAHLNSRSIDIRRMGLKPESFVAIFQMIDEGTISANTAKEILPRMLDGKKEARDIVEESSLLQITDTGELEEIVRKVIAENSKATADYYQGKSSAFTFLIGQVMRKSRGKASPRIVNRILKEKLN